MQLAIADADVACSGEQLMQQGSPLLLDTGVVRSQQRQPAGHLYGFEANPEMFELLRWSLDLNGFLGRAKRWPAKAIQPRAISAGPKECRSFSRILECRCSSSGTKSPSSTLSITNSGKRNAAAALASGRFEGMLSREARRRAPAP
jgi:hypothetical protein